MAAHQGKIDGLMLGVGAGFDYYAENIKRAPMWIDLERAHQLLKKKTSNVADNLHYKVFDLKRRFERIVHPTGLFIVLLGVDGAGKTTIAENGPDGNVKCCLQKKSVEVLREAGAVNESGCVDIDTGALIFSTDIMKSLYSLIETDADYDRNVNERTRLSLYADFLYPLASDSTLEDFYREKPEGEFCPELTAARTRVWEVLRPYRMKLLRLAPAKFIHFGTTREILELMNGGVDEYHYLGWSRKVGSSIRSDVSGYNSVLSSRASVGKDCYLEVSYVHGNSRIGSHSVLSYIDVQDQVIPDNVVLHGLKQRNGKFIVRIFGVNDNPKENRLFGRDLDELKDTLGVRFWEENGQAHTLWSAALYQEADTIREATDAALELYEIVTGGKDFDKSLWTATSHKSLCAGFNEADPDAIIAWNKRMADLVTMDGIAKAIRDQVPAGSIRKLQSLTKIQKEWLRKRLRKADFGEKMRLHYYLGVILEDENEVQECFRIIQSEVLEATIKSLAYNEQARIVTDHHTVRLPLRVNWGGGWSDTPPYCNEKGGTVLNAAILLNGEKPVEVTLERIPEQKVVFDSRDMDVHGEFDTIEPLQATGDPYDPFALQKACLLACGIIPREGHTLGEICQYLFCFFVILFAHSDSHGNGTSDSYQGAKRSEKCNDRTAYACTCKSQCAIFGNMSDIHPVNNTVKYIDKLRGHRRDGKLEHQSAYGCLAKICCCVHFNFPHPFDRDCRTCMCSSPCILIIVNFNRYGQKKL